MVVVSASASRNYERREVGLYSLPAPDYTQGAEYIRGCGVPPPLPLC